ncbi:MAG: MoaD/ThiS family protein [Bacteriovoracaceae bacterium]|nr:MoaD/ThiS family protein [Bacteriovoracaceae bacterium]
MRVTVKYFALLKDITCKSSEFVETEAATVDELYHELNQKYNFPISSDIIRFALNDEYVKGDTPLSCGNTIVFISPIAGG